MGRAVAHANERHCDGCPANGSQPARIGEAATSWKVSAIAEVRGHVRQRRRRQSAARGGRITRPRGDGKVSRITSFLGRTPRDQDRGVRSHGAAP